MFPTTKTCAHEIRRKGCNQHPILARFQSVYVWLAKGLRSPGWLAGWLVHSLFTTLPSFLPPSLPDTVQWYSESLFRTSWLLGRDGDAIIRRTANDRLNGVGGQMVPLLTHSPLFPGDRRGSQGGQNEVALVFPRC